MSNKTKTAVAILFSALAVGLFGNLMLRQTPWGLNAFLFVTAFTGAMAAIAYRYRPELLTMRTMALQGAMIFFASMFLIRDSIELRVYDTFAIIILMGVLILPNFDINQRFAGIFHYAVGTVWAGIVSLLAPFLLFGSDIEWKDLPGNRLSRSAFSVLRGLTIALPIFLIFGALFMAADAAFENFANRIVNFDIETVISHVMLTSFLAWLTAGYFRGSLVEPLANRAAAAVVSVIPKSDEPKTETSETSESRVDRFTAEPAEDTSLPDNATVVEHMNKEDQPRKEEAQSAEQNAEEPKRIDWQNWDSTKFPSIFTLGKIETIIILGLIDILFLSFVVFQLPYLFGGFELVQNTPDLKLADFARRGFGELVAVSFMVLPLLLATHWLLRRDGSRTELVFRILAGVQVVLLFVIMASAMQRLVLLTGELGYGWTTVRFYPMVVIVWLAIVFAWFGWTVLCGKRNNFAWGALWSAIIVLGVTNLMNPDDFIARKNIQLMQQGREYDAYYNASELSDDAVPVLMQNLNLMNSDDRCQTMSDLYGRLVEARGEGDIRSRNLSRELAYAALESNSGMLANRPECEGLTPRIRKLGEYGH